MYNVKMTHVLSTLHYLDVENVVKSTIYRHFYLIQASIKQDGNDEDIKIMLMS